MLTKIIAGAEPAPLSARVVADAHPLPEMGFGKPAGASGTSDRGTVGTGAPVAMDGRTALRDFFIAQDRRRRAAQFSTGGDAA